MMDILCYLFQFYVRRQLLFKEEDQHDGHFLLLV